MSKATVSSRESNFAVAVGAEGVESIPAPVKSDTVSPSALLCCGVFSELCCPGAKPRRWATGPQHLLHVLA